MSGWGNNWNGPGYGGFGGGMRGGWGGGGPYGYNNMTGFNNRPRFGGNFGNKPLSLTEVKDWLDKQQPFVLQSVLKHSRELLTKKHNVPVEDMSDWYGDEDTDKNQFITKSGESDVVAYL